LSSRAKFGALLRRTQSKDLRLDGLLHLSGVSVEGKVGQSRALWEYNFDYQQADGFYVPLHVTVTAGATYSYTYTFVNCQAFDKADAPTKSPEIHEPR
jgi:hypothetical protein